MKYKLSEIAEIVSGGTPSTKNSSYWNGEICWITPKDLSNNKKRYISHGERSITEQGLNNSSAIMIPKNSILFTSRAPIGYIAISKNEVCTNQGFKSLVCDDSKCYFLYLYYWLLNNIDYIKSQANGSTFQEISGSAMKKIEIDLPTINTQKKIAKILDCFDKKIELNNQINDNLYEIQKEYFKKIFNNELYKEIKLEDLCNITAGGDAPKDKSNVFSDEYPIPIVSNGIDNEGIYGYTKESKINKKSITISARGTIGHKVLRNYSYYPIVRLISLTPVNPHISAEYIFYALDNIQLMGTGTTQQQLTVPMVKKIKIRMYNIDLIEQFTKYSTSLNKKIESNKLQNKTLSELRDTLLPKLMNGEIDLDKVEI